MTELWKVFKVTNHVRWGERIYEVSNLGRCKLNGEIVQPTIINSGYYSFGRTLVHRAVAQCFIPNPDNKKYVDHIDTNRLNNNIDNLRWVTCSENSLNILSLSKRIGKKRTLEQRKNIAKGTHEAAIGRRWYTDGKNSYFIYPEDAEDNYRQGRIIKHRRTKKEMLML